ncbi:MAG: hypothetical protein IJ877_05770 [Candidatus Gastranaerophilales bacterium]|nr:hypothetical protein [Candidatus Gastranaerophilales bacterium]
MSEIVQVKNLIYTICNLKVMFNSDDNKEIMQRLSQFENYFLEHVKKTGKILKKSMKQLICLWIEQNLLK